MKKVLIYYFSGTGNTRKIAREYEKAFRAHGIEPTLRELSHRAPVKTDDAEEYDRIGIGYPIHAFNAPKIVLELCKALPKRDASRSFKYTFVFKTSGEPVRMSDASSIKTVKLLNRRGYSIANEYQYVMPYNIIFRHTDAQAYKMWQTAQALVPLDVEDIINFVPSLKFPNKPFLGGAAAWLLRIEHGGARLIGRGFKATNACINCGLCVKDCPAENIRVGKNGKIEFGGKCMLCMRCVFECPKNAIVPGILKKWTVNGDYSFEPPDAPEPPSAHDEYCKKAYARYYAQAEQRTAEPKNQD